ncbi:MAG: membrane protein insertion efficiency factor YidD [Simkaniaceae bacterium]|nr:membrane protein insertion efficiency factor YidD [Simkaniaceae bacterium]
MAQFLTLIIRGYQKWISPLLGRRCRFYPTCSQYALDALKIHGLRHGLYLTIKRLLKCHPWHPGGVDFVIPKRRRKYNEIE